MRRLLTVSGTAIALVLTSTAAGATPAATPAAAAPAATPGSPGIGDPYYPDDGNGGYDVGHYDIRLRYWPATDRLTGTATILATATQDLTRFDLDFVLAVTSVRVNNRAAAFWPAGDHELVVQPARTVAKGADLTVVVQYSDIPSQVRRHGATLWRRTADGALAVDEPHTAWWWFPSNDHPLDKATYDVSVLVPDGIQVISNGRQPSAPAPVLGGWTRWYWREARPQATYLAVLVIGKYDLHTDVAANGTPIVTAYSTSLGDLAGAARASVERTNEVLEWESRLLGPYPFEAQGGVVVPPRELGFALEAQTRPVYDGAFWAAGSDMYVVVHENAHEWFGDSVSVAGWRDIWLNEGFASYLEWLWSEAHGEGTAAELFAYTFAHYPATDPFWQVKPGDPGASALFADAVYGRGAMALQALRMTVGDPVFFRILRTWAARKRYGNGTIEQFAALAEQLSGENLHPLFTTWLFTPGRPTLPPGWLPGSRAGSASAVAGAWSLPTNPSRPASWPAIERVRP